MQQVLDAEPWCDAAFRADLRAFAGGTVAASRLYADDCRLLARLAARVPREAWDTRGATAWTSFLAEVAVARRISAQAAAVLVDRCTRTARLMPRTLGLLDAGELPVGCAVALVDALRAADDALVRRADQELAERAAHLTPSRVTAAVDKLALEHDAELAARRQATATASRGTRRSPLPDGQAELVLTGPALVLAQVQEALDADARAWRAALAGSGDGRGVDQLRFDLAAARLLGGHGSVAPEVAGTVLPAAGSPSWWHDQRFSRPVQLQVTVPVTTALGLSEEPGWLPGHGWLAAPAVRALLPVAELRQLCVVAAAAGNGASAGHLVDVADRVVRPPRDPVAVREELLRMATQPFAVTDKTWREETRHDPSPALAEFVRLRDQQCDGPATARPVVARACDLDHHLPYREPDPPPQAGRSSPSTGVVPSRWVALLTAGTVDPARATDGAATSPTPAPLPSGPTAAWNLRARGRRTHGLKHRGWRSLRGATGTLWTTPAGQLTVVLHDLHPVPPLAPGAVLPDPVEQHEHDQSLLEADHALPHEWPLADDAPREVEVPGAPQPGVLQPNVPQPGVPQPDEPPPF